MCGHDLLSAQSTKTYAFLQGVKGGFVDLDRYRLMQRAIGDMSLLQKIDADVSLSSTGSDAVARRADAGAQARGYWKLFSKGIITSKFWNSATGRANACQIKLIAYCPYLSARF